MEAVDRNADITKAACSYCSDHIAQLFPKLSRPERKAYEKRLRTRDNRQEAALRGVLLAWSNCNAATMARVRTCLATTANGGRTPSWQDFVLTAATQGLESGDALLGTATLCVVEGVVFSTHAPEAVPVDGAAPRCPPPRSEPILGTSVTSSDLPLPWSVYLAEVDALAASDGALAHAEAFTAQLLQLVAEKRGYASRRAHLLASLEARSGTLAYLEVSPLDPVVESALVTFGIDRVERDVDLLTTTLDEYDTTREAVSLAASREERRRLEGELVVQEQTIDALVSAMRATADAAVEQLPPRNTPSLASNVTATRGAFNAITVRSGDATVDAAGSSDQPTAPLGDPAAADVDAGESATKSESRHVDPEAPSSERSVDLPSASALRGDARPVERNRGGAPSEPDEETVGVTDAALSQLADPPLDRGSEESAQGANHRDGVADDRSVLDTSEAASTPELSPPESESESPRSLGGYADERVLLAPKPVSERPPARVSRLSSRLRSLDDFVAHYWVRGDGVVVEAPWNTDKFGVDLIARVEADASAPIPHFGRLLVLVTAAQELKIDAPRMRDIEDIHRLWNGGTPEPDTLRYHVIQDELQPDARPTLRRRLMTLLEALSPGDIVMAQALVRDLMRSLSLSHDLSAAFEELFALRMRGVDDPTGLIRRLVKRQEELTPALLEGRLKQAREDVRSLHAASVIPTFLKTRFCQEAWQEFLDRLRERASPVLGARSAGELDPEALPSQAEVEEIHRQVADDAGSRFADRSRMNRRAAELGQAIAAVRDTARALHESKRPRTEADSMGVNIHTLRRAATNAGPRDERILRNVLGLALRMPEIEPTTASTAFSRDDIEQHPDLLLGLLQDLDSDDGDELTVAQVERPIVAAAALVYPTAPDVRTDESTLVPARSVLAARVWPWMSAPMQAQIEHAAADAEREQRERLERIASVTTRLAAAGSLAADDLRQAFGRVEAALRAPTRRFVELGAWLERVEAEAEAILQGEEISLRSQSEGLSVERREAVRQFIDSGRLDRAVALLRGSASVEIDQRTRASVFRNDAATLHPTPTASLRALVAQNDAAFKSMIDRWFERTGTPQEQRSRRTTFMRQALKGIYESSDVDRSRQDATIISMQIITGALASRNLEPTFLPQLRQFTNLVVPSVPLPSSRTFVAEVMRTAGELSRGGLVVVLAPELSPERRADFLQEVRGRQLSAVIFDDLDLVRIFGDASATHDPTLALLELAIEQLDWERYTPYRLARVEGQAVLREMYVGRAHEARELATSATYTRLFSGRKLGKSALLRIVEHEYDGEALPSGNTLRVVYVTAVGVRDESAMVDRILSALREKLGRDLTVRVDRSVSPADRLAESLAAELDRDPGQSLLLVLDEADAFVEFQIDEARRRREECLSFIMRSRISASADARGLPRIRFVFTGYRATHRDEGAWANWGRVLRLQPLPEEDAALLVLGPLGRIGIDAREQASVIAHRCGFQPAVLLTFGEQLVHRLAKRVPPATRTRRATEVTPDDVAGVGDLEAVRAEVEQIAKNNFDGNPAGLLIFGAMLGVFLELGATAEVDDLRDRMVRALRQISPLIAAGLGGDDGSMLQLVDRALADLGQRQLVSENQRGSRRTHSLVFPHHLRLLHALADESHLRRLAHELEQHGVTSAASGEVGWLPADALDAIRRLARRGTQTTSPIVVPVLVTLGGADVFLRERFRHAVLDPLGFDAGRVMTTAADHRNPTYPDEACVLGVHADDVLGLLHYDHELQCAPVLAGGGDLCDLARSTAEYVVDGVPHMLQDLPLYRLTTPRVRGWLEVTRGLTFGNPQDLTRLVDATAGIPFLVARLDRSLTGDAGAGAGVQVSGRDVNAALADLETALDDAARALRAGAPDWALGTRAFELLRMIGMVSRTEAAWSLPLDTLCAEWWDMLSANNEVARPLRPFERDVREDREALAELQALGLLPVSADARERDIRRFVDIGPGDPVRRLAEKLI